MICDEAQPGGGIALNYALNSLVTTHDHVFLVTVLPLAMVDFAFMGLLPEHDVALDLKKLETMKCVTLSLFCTPFLLCYKVISQNQK